MLIVLAVTSIMILSCLSKSYYKNRSDEKKALANIFSIEVLTTFENRNFKGLDINEVTTKPQKYILGKRGIPIRYEDIEQS